VTYEILYIFPVFVAPVLRCNSRPMAEFCFHHFLLTRFRQAGKVSPGLFELADNLIKMISQATNLKYGNRIIGNSHQVASDIFQDLTSKNGTCLTNDLCGCVAMSERKLSTASLLFIPKVETAATYNYVTSVYYKPNAVLFSLRTTC
jgi:hypothetical protein